MKVNLVKWWNWPFLMHIYVDIMKKCKKSMEESKLSDSVFFYTTEHSKNEVIFVILRFYHRYQFPKSTQTSNFLAWKCGVTKKDTATILSFGLWNWFSVGPIGLAPRWFNFKPKIQKLWLRLLFLRHIIFWMLSLFRCVNYTFSKPSGRKL